MRPVGGCAPMQATLGRRNLLAMSTDRSRNSVRQEATGRHAKRMLAYGGSLAMVTAALLLGLLLQRAGTGTANAGLVFLTAILMSAVTYGLGPGLMACVASALAYNFFFFPPLYTLAIADSRNVVTVIIFAIVAIIASNLAARIRTQTMAAQERAAMMESLYLFSRKLAGAFTLDDLLWAIAFQFADMLHVRVVILLPSGNELVIRAGYPPEDRIAPEAMQTACGVWSSAQDFSAGVAAAKCDRWLFLPMRTGRGAIGIVGFEHETPDRSFSDEDRRLLDSLADQAALAIERLNLSDEFEKARLSAERERLRSALLTSISHDLKTPLASILGSAGTMKNRASSLSPAARDELITTIHDEAERLNRFIANLLDMTRLESGAIAPKLEWIDVGDVIGSAVRRAGPVLKEHNIRIDVEPNLPLVRIDPVLFEQCLFNLLDNAGKYSDAGTQIQLLARSVEGKLELDVIDEGSGIPPDDLERVFDKFFRAQTSDRKPAGTGLGLSICRGFIDAMGGRIVASNRTDARGAQFSISFGATDPAREEAA